MIDMAMLGEAQTRRDLAQLLHTAVELSGRNRCEIAREAEIHKDALRRTLAGERSPSVGEALRILASAGMAPHAQLLLFLGAGGDLTTRWLQTDLAQFFEEFIGELPGALERVLGNQVHDVKPRWAKGTAHRVASVMRVDSLEEPDRPRRATPSTRSPRRCALLVKPQPPGAGPPSSRRHPVVIGLA